MRLKKTGNLTIEYAFLIVIIVVALIGMSVYLKRALCGKWREMGDTFGYGRQYEPGLTKCYDAGGNEISCK